MLILPYSTDAPVYHWPYATVGLIVTNVLLFFAVSAEAVYEPGSPWLLRYGEGLEPLQWIGSRFTHGGFFHLLGNMMFLWVFGLVVEGKIGPARFLTCYALVGLGQAALEQLGMLGYSGQVPGSLGASAAVFGIMVMAILWAPDNGVSFFWWFFYMGTAEATVMAFGGAFVAIDLALAMMLGGHAASSLLHIMGAALGLPIGLWLLKSRRVDCEGWDLFTRYGGGATPSEQEEEAREAKVAELAEKTAERDRVTLAEAREHFDRYLAGGKPAAALQLYQKLRDRGDGWRLETNRLRPLVQSLHAEKRWRESAPLMAELIDADPENAPALRVALAQLCVTQFERPGRALELLAAADATVLSPAQRQKAAAIAARAHALQDEGVVEIDDAAW